MPKRLYSLAALMLLAGCGTPTNPAMVSSRADGLSAKSTPGSIRVEDLVKRIFTRYDRNGNGTLEYLADEIYAYRVDYLEGLNQRVACYTIGPLYFQAKPGKDGCTPALLTALLAQYDGNGDGALDGKELAALMKDFPEKVNSKETKSCDLRTNAGKALNPLTDDRLRLTLSGGQGLYDAPASVGIGEASTPVDALAKKIFTRYDRNGDGKIEYLKSEYSAYRVEDTAKPMKVRFETYEYSVLLFRNSPPGDFVRPEAVKRYISQYDFNRDGKLNGGVSVANSEMALFAKDYPENLWSREVGAFEPKDGSGRSLNSLNDDRVRLSATGGQGLYD